MAVKAKKIITYVWVAAAAFVVSFAGTCIYSYHSNVAAWEELTREKFKATLRQEISRRDTSSTDYWTSEEALAFIPTDKPLTLTVRSEVGAREVVIPVHKLQNTLATIKPELAVQSLCLEREPLDADSVACRWSKLLGDSIPAEVGVCIRATDAGSGQVQSSCLSGRVAVADSLLTCYLGNLWEVEAMGYWHYRWADAVAWGKAAGWGLLCMVLAGLGAWGIGRRRREAFDVRRAELAEETVYCLGKRILFYPDRNRICRDKSTANLNPQGCLLMLALVQAGERGVQTSELVQKIWKDNEKEADPALLHPVVSRLRKSLQQFPSLEIVTVDGGYRLVYPNAHRKWNGKIRVKKDVSVSHH